MPYTYITCLEKWRCNTGVWIIRVLLISQFCQFDIRYNFYRYSEYVDTCNQPSFWRLFWQRAPYWVVVKSIALSFLLECTFDCCAMSRACARVNGTGLHSSRDKHRFQCKLVYHQIWVKICLFHNNMQRFMLMNGNGMMPGKILIYYEWFRCEYRYKMYVE